MLKKYRNIVALALIIVLSVSSNFNVWAKDINYVGKHNFDFISIDDISNVEYNYEENGKLYKVLEQANETLSVVETTVYEVCKNGKLSLVDKYTTNISVEDDKMVVLTTYQNKEVTKDIIKINKECCSVIKEISNSKASTGWIHIYNYEGSVKFAKYTLTVVIAVLTGAIAGLGGGATAGAAIAGVSAIANIIVEERIPYVYMKQKMYYYYPDTSGIPTKYRDVTQCYENENGTGYLGTTTEEGNIILGGN